MSSPLTPAALSGRESLWSRPVWRDARAMRDVEKGIVVDALRQEARAMMIEAMQGAGLWSTESPRRMKRGRARHAVQLAAALQALVPDDYADLMLANARMAAHEMEAAALAFSRLERDGGDIRIRGYATLGLAVVAGLRQHREVGFACCRAAIASPIADIAVRGAMSLVVQGAIGGQASQVAFAVDAVVACGEERDLDRTCAALRRFSGGPHGTRGETAIRTLRGAGRLAGELLDRLSGNAVP